MTRHYALLIVLGLAHGISDGAAGLLLGSLNHALALWQVGLLVLIYNALAFGGQPVAGFVVDQLRQPKLAAGVGLVTMSLALLVAPWQPAVAAGIAGIGSALFQVGGGALALCVTPERATGPGLFAAPGVVGLAIGGALAASTPDLGSASPGWVFMRNRHRRRRVSNPVRNAPLHLKMVFRPLAGLTACLTTAILNL